MSIKSGTATAYSQCVGDAMRGKKLSPDERKREFCISSKLCSGKASARDDANRLCEEAARNPSTPKKRSRKVSPRGGASMELVLLTTTDCKPCSAAKQYLRAKLDSGLIRELNIQKDTQAADLAAKYHFDSVPKLLVLDENGAPFSELQITDTAQSI